MSEGRARHLSRRAWIAGASGVVAAGLVRTKADALSVLAQEAPARAPNPTKVPGRLTSEVGRRATGEQPRRLTGPARFQPAMPGGALSSTVLPSGSPI